MLQEQLTHTLGQTPASLQALSEFIDPLLLAKANEVSTMTQGEVTRATALAPLPQSLKIFDRAYFSAVLLLDWRCTG